MLKPIMLPHHSTHKVLPVVLWGFIISFLGSLPPGTTNILTVQLAATDGYNSAIWFSIGCMIAEVICVGVCLLIMDRIMRSPVFLKALQWLSLFIIIWLIVSTFRAQKAPVPTLMHPVIFGFVLMIINPVQLPFWFGWTTILGQRKILGRENNSRLQYILGIALGSIAASVLFIAGGTLISGWMMDHEHTIRWIFGSVFVVIAVVQLWKILRGPVYRSADR